MPITLLNEGEKAEIVSIKGTDDTKKHLSNLGFAKGRIVSLQKFDGVNYIFVIDDNRFALSKDLAKRIIVKELWWTH